MDADERIEPTSPRRPASTATPPSSPPPPPPPEDTADSSNDSSGDGPRKGGLLHPDIMGFGDHLEDLRRRILLAIFGLIPALIIGLLVGGPLLELLTVPVTNALLAAGEPSGLLATGPLEAFISYLKVSFGVSILLAFPWLLYQAWMFIAPGLYQQERRFVYFLLPFSALLTAASSLFLYYALLPISLFFLIQFGTGIATSSPTEMSVDGEPPAALIAQLDASMIPVLEEDPPESVLKPGMRWINPKRNEVRLVTRVTTDPDDPSVTTDATIRNIRLRGDGLIAQEYRVGEYVSLLFRLGLVFALSFQLPVVMLLIGWLDIFRYSDLAGARRYVLFGCAIAGAVLTPQDPWSMILLGGVLYMLFELGLILMRFVPASRIAGKAESRDGAFGDSEDDL